MALVHVIDIATGQVVAAYPVPPTVQFEIGPDQMVQFVDIPHGDPASPNVTIEVINDTDVAVTTADGTVLIQGLYAFLEAGEDVRLLFADTGRTYGDDGAVPQFASLDDFIATAAGGPGGAPGGGSQSGTGGRGNDGGIAPPDLNLFHIPAPGVDGLIPRPEFDDPIDIETDFINVEEPQPVPPAPPTVAMVHDETRGVQNENDDGVDDEDDVDPPLPDDLADIYARLCGHRYYEFSAVAVMEPAESLQAMTTIAFGPDETISLDAIVNGTDSGLDSGGDNVLLYNDSDNVIYGSTGGEEGEVVFIVYMDPTTGEVWFVQCAAIDHDNPNDADEAGDESGTGFVDETLALSYTLTNADGSGSAPLIIEIQDDGLGRLGVEVSSATVDEDGLVADGDTNSYADTNNDGDNNILTSTGFIGVFGDFGLDGPGEVIFALQDAPAGLTSQGDDVTYSVSGDGLTLTAMADGRTVFTVTLDHASNEYTVVLSDVIDHDGDFTAGVLAFDLRVSDGDGDFVVIDDAFTINIVDAQPIANDDMDMAVEGGAATTGNVITGVDNDASPNDGTLAADAAGADGLTVIRSVSHNGITYTLAVDGLSVTASDASTDHSFDGTTLTFDTAEGGSLSIDLTGGTVGFYSYTPPASVDNSEVNPEEDFVYVIEDFDGDTDDATLTIEVKPGNAPTGGLEQITVDDEGLPDGIPGGDGDVAGEDTFISGTLDGFSFGGDGPGSIDFASLDTTMEMVGGEMVTYSWDGGTNTLTATSARGDVFQVVLTDPVAGTYEFTLLLPAIHAVPGTEDDLVVSLTYTVRDSDGSTATGTLEVTIDDDEPAVGTTQNLVLSNEFSNSGTADLDLGLGADGPGGYALTMAMDVDGNQTALVEGAGVYGLVPDNGGTIVEQMSSDDVVLVWHDNGDGTWSAVLDGTAGNQQAFEDATVFTVSVNSDGTYTVTLDDNLTLDGAFDTFDLDFTGGVRGGNSDQLIFFDSEANDDDNDGIPDGSTVMGLAVGVNSDGSPGTVNSSAQGMGVSQGDTIGVNDDGNGTDVSEELTLFFGSPVDPDDINGPNDPDFMPLLVGVAVITFDSLNGDEFAILAVNIDGQADPVFFKIAGTGNGASTDETLTITQGTAGDGALSGSGTELDPYVVDMTGGTGTAVVDGQFSELDFTADVDTDSSYRVVSAEGQIQAEGIDTQTTFTAEGTDSDGDTATTTFDVTFNSGTELTGGDSDDVLVGNGGSQSLDGGQGNDLMTGNEGADIFQWAGADIDLGLDGSVDFVDTVTDFSGAVEGDKLDISALLSDLGANAGNIDSFFQTMVNGDGKVELQVDTTGGGSSWQTFAIIESGDGLLNAALETDVDNGILTGL